MVGSSWKTGMVRGVGRSMTTAIHRDSRYSYIYIALILSFDYIEVLYQRLYTLLCTHVISTTLVSTFQRDSSECSAVFSLSSCVSLSNGSS